MLISFQALNAELPGWNFRFVLIILSHRTGCLHPKFGLSSPTWGEGMIVSWPGGPAGHAPHPLRPPRKWPKAVSQMCWTVPRRSPQQEPYLMCLLPPAAGQKEWESSWGLVVSFGPASPWLREMLCWYVLND